MEAHTAKFISEMKAYAAMEAREAVRCRKEWRALASVAFLGSIVCLPISIFMHLWIPKLCVITIGIAWFFVGKSTWKQGDFFARKWMELREEALRFAKEAEERSRTSW